MEVKDDKDGHSATGLEAVMDSKMVMEIPEVKELVTKFISTMAEYSGTIKVGRFRMKSRSYTTGDDCGHWPFRDRILYRFWYRRPIILWYQHAANTPRIRVNLRRLRRSYEEIKEAVANVAETYEASRKREADQQESRLARVRENSKRKWEER